jgi:hypothetical protein
VEEGIWAATWSAKEDMVGLCVNVCCGGLCKSCKFYYREKIVRL